MNLFSSRKQSLVLKLAPKKPVQPTAEPSPKEAEQGEKEKGEEKEKEPEKLDKEDKEKKEEAKPAVPETSNNSSKKSKEKEVGEVITAPDVAQEVLGKSVYVAWPYLREAVVLGVSDATCRVSQLQGIVNHTSEDAGVWQKEMKYQLGKYKTKKAIDLGLSLSLSLSLLIFILLNYTKVRCM